MTYAVVRARTACSEGTATTAWTAGTVPIACTETPAAMRWSAGPVGTLAKVGHRWTRPGHANPRLACPEGSTTRPFDRRRRRGSPDDSRPSARLRSGAHPHRSRRGCRAAPRSGPPSRSSWSSEPSSRSGSRSRPATRRPAPSTGSSAGASTPAKRRFSADSLASELHNPRVVPRPGLSRRDVHRGPAHAPAVGVTGGPEQQRQRPRHGAGAPGRSRRRLGVARRDHRGAGGAQATADLTAAHRRPQPPR